MMCEHPAVGERIVNSIEPLAHLSPVIRAEHERWDGRGYPDGLSGEEIPLIRCIVFARDAFHGMPSTGPIARRWTSGRRSESSKETPARSSARAPSQHSSKSSGAPQNNPTPERRFSFSIGDPGAILGACAPETSKAGTRAPNYKSRALSLTQRTTQSFHPKESL